jgi:hypothetical protein
MHCLRTHAPLLPLVHRLLARTQITGRSGERQGRSERLCHYFFSRLDSHYSWSNYPFHASRHYLWSLRHNPREDRAKQQLKTIITFPILTIPKSLRQMSKSITHCWNQFPNWLILPYHTGDLTAELPGQGVRALTLREKSRQHSRPNLVRFVSKNKDKKHEAEQQQQYTYIT